jgi:leucyl/phenylalanyl-tRNA--protein transferase
MAPLLDPALADEIGLVAIGGDLSPGRLVQAYRAGVFPWFDDDYPVLWWSPDPRAIFDLDRFRTSRRLARRIRSCQFQFTINRAFGEVMRGCADRPEGTWITDSMLDAYERLHRLGLAHSLEAWQDGELAGGIYGVAIGGFFAGESMFHRRTDASKAALAVLIHHLRDRGFRLFDIQMLTLHTTSLGAVEIPRDEYLTRLQRALQVNARFTSSD